MSTSAKTWATRRLSTSQGRPVHIRLSIPDRVRADEWKVQISITGLGKAIRQDVFGYDAIQAIVVALATTRALLIQSGRDLSWLGGELGDTGFPFYVSDVHGVKFTRKLEKKVQAILDAESVKLERRHRAKHNRR
jgi:hypothetical protein